MTAPAPVDVPAIVERLANGNRAALSLHLRGRRVVAVVIDGSGVEVTVHELDTRVEFALEAYARNLRLFTPNPFQFDISAEEELDVGLSDVVPSTVVERVSSASTLIVIPHGVLHLLPWAAMSVEDQYLFERAAVGVLPNLACLPLLDVEPLRDPGVALLGDPVYTTERYKPLMHSAAEINDIARLYGHKVIAPPATGKDATEAAFWGLMSSEAARTAVLHVSAHGTLDADEPLASGLLLGESTVDAAELITRSCASPEVVLSACSTGWRPLSARGLELAGDDALGLPASFLEAGARFLLVSVPQAKDDVTRAFTTAWHRNRLSGLTPLNAYRAAQQQMLTTAPDRIWAWAGMTAYGAR